MKQLALIAATAFAFTLGVKMGTAAAGEHAELAGHITAAMEHCELKPDSFWEFVSQEEVKERWSGDASVATRMQAGYDAFTTSYRKDPKGACAEAKELFQ